MSPAIVNAMREPSGDHAGVWSCDASFVSLATPEPLGGLPLVGRAGLEPATDGL